jgi:fumarate hydratase class II
MGLVSATEPPRRPPDQRQRVEHDSLGEVEVPQERLWGAQTQRCLLHFRIGGDRFRWGRTVVRALGIVKKCAAEANGRLGRLTTEQTRLLTAAAQEVIEGRWDSEFPLAAFQTGSGTQTNMNANEVLANRANKLAGQPLGSYQPVHPNDHANCSQSSNDVFPTVMHLAIADGVDGLLTPAVMALRRSLDEKAKQYADLVMMGRTHLQDAAPVMLGQVIGGWSDQLRAAQEQVARAMASIYELAIGATAVGTGLNAPARFAEEVVEEIARETGKPFIPARNKFAAISAHDAVAALSGSLRTLAGALCKIANDVRWYGSGPRAGIGELRLPANEPGSSIMPGKVNPTQCEALTQVAAQVYGNDCAVAFAASQGSFQLNTFKPVMLHNVMESIQLLAEACRSFDEFCVQGLEADSPRIREHLDDSLVGATALSPHIGYEKAAMISLRAYRAGISLREAALQSGFVSERQFEEWVRFEDMADASESDGSK